MAIWIIQDGRRPPSWIFEAGIQRPFHTLQKTAGKCRQLTGQVHARCASQSAMQIPFQWDWSSDVGMLPTFQVYSSVCTEIISTQSVAELLQRIKRYNFL